MPITSSSSGKLTPDPVPSSVEQAIRSFVETRLHPFGIESVRIEPGHDHDGDPVIYVFLKHRLLEKPIEIGNVIALDRELRDVAWQKGESRFLHIQHEYDEKQGVAGQK
jgi:hypothetical protein